MTEKNIVVTSGRPMNPGGGGGGGGGMGMGSWLSGYTYAHISGPDPAQRQAFTSVHRYESNARKRIVAAYEKSLQALPKTVTDEVARLESELLAPTKAQLIALRELSLSYRTSIIRQSLGVMLKRNYRWLTTVQNLLLVTYPTILRIAPVTLAVKVVTEPWSSCG